MNDVEVSPRDSILFPRRRTYVGLLLVGGVFMAVGMLGAREIGGFVFYFLTGFWALGILIACVSLLPGSLYLRITEEGLSYAALFRVRTFPWHVIDEFFIDPFGHVGFDFVPEYDRWRFVRRVNRILQLAEWCLPDTFGRSAEELAALLNQCRERYGERDDELPRGNMT